MSRPPIASLTPATGGDDVRQPEVACRSTARRRWLSATAMAAVLPVWPTGPARADEPAKGGATPAPQPQVATAGETPSRPTMAQLFTRRTIRQARLSPDGLHLAMVGNAPGRQVVLMQDLTTKQMRVVLPAPGESEFWISRNYGSVMDVQWVLPDLMVIRLSFGMSLGLRPDGTVVRRMSGLFAERLPDGADGEPRGLVIAGNASRIVNLRTGAWTEQPSGLPESEDGAWWAFDAQGRLRAALTTETSRWSGETVWTQWYRSAAPGAAWEQLEQHKDQDRVWEPMRVLADDQIAVRARAGRDTLAVFRYDPAKRQIGELMAGHETDDIVALSGLDAAAFDLVITGGLKRKLFWFDARWARLQKSVDQVLPGAINWVSGTDPEGHVLVYSRSDVDPGRWHALDVKAGRLKEIAVAMPDIEPARMRPMEAYRYRGRDGLSVPAYLTRPVGSGPAPTVVLIHGGPWIRDDWAWDDEVQLLAAQGYAVFQPQFRGSSGFGKAYEQAGYRQWGESMQDDITDGVQDLIDRGIADPTRLAIFGGSYGGYAAMWGLVKTPKLYRCGISFAGISDLDDFLRTSWFDDSTAASRLMRRRLVGDPSTARAQLRAVSPIRHIDRIEAPLLLVHGSEDKRVLPGQSERMVDAMKERGKRVEWMSLETGHGFDAPDSKLRIKYFEKVLAFLAEHLGSTASAPAPAQPISTSEVDSRSAGSRTPSR